MVFSRVNRMCSRGFSVISSRRVSRVSLISLAASVAMRIYLIQDQIYHTSAAGQLFVVNLSLPDEKIIIA